MQGTKGWGGGGCWQGGYPSKGCCGGCQPWAWLSWGVGGGGKRPRECEELCHERGIFPFNPAAVCQLWEQGSCWQHGTPLMHSRHLLCLWLRLCGFLGAVGEARRQNPLALHPQHPHRRTQEPFPGEDTEMLLLLQTATGIQHRINQNLWSSHCGRQDLHRPPWTKSGPRNQMDGGRTRTSFPVPHLPQELGMG